MSARGNSMGKIAETITVERLVEEGWEILERNFRTRYGELDIIGRAEGIVVFVEVKSAQAGTRRGPVKPAHAVDRRKQAQVRRIATQWLASATLRQPCAGFRFDVIALTFARTGDIAEYEHLRGAF